MLFAVDDHRRFAVDVLLVAVDAVLRHQRLDPALARPDPSAAPVDPCPIGPDLGKRAACFRN